MAMNKGIGYIHEDRQHEGLAMVLNIQENIGMTVLDFFYTFHGFSEREKTQRYR